MLDGDIFKALDEFGEEGICDFGDYEAEQFAAPGDQGAGLGVGDEVEFFDDVPDLFGHRGVDSRDAIDGA